MDMNFFNAALFLSFSYGTRKPSKSPETLAIWLTIGVFFFLGCQESSLTQNQTKLRLNTPTDILKLDDAFGLVVNGNIRLQEQSASLIAIDFSNQTLLEESKTYLDGFAGRPAIDQNRNLVVVPDRSHQIHLFETLIDSNGPRFSPIKTFASDDRPMAAHIHESSAYVICSSGRLMHIDLDGPSLMDLDPNNEDALGLNLDLSFADGTMVPAGGSNLLAISDHHLWIAVSGQSVVHVVDRQTMSLLGGLNLIQTQDDVDQNLSLSDLWVSNGQLMGNVPQNGSVMYANLSDLIANISQSTLQTFEPNLIPLSFEPTIGHADDQSNLTLILGSEGQMAKINNTSLDLEVAVNHDQASSIFIRSLSNEVWIADPNRNNIQRFDLSTLDPIAEINP